MRSTVMNASRICCMVLLAVAVSEKIGTAAQISFDFSSGIGPDFAPVDTSGGLWSVVGSEGDLHISKAVDSGTVNGKQSIQGGIASKFNLVGDFTVDVDFQLSTFSNADNGWNGSVLVAQRRGGGEFFEVMRWATVAEQLIEVYGSPGGPAGNQGNTLLSGTYRVTRSGKEFAGFVATSRNGPFTEIGRITIESFDAPAFIRLVGMQVSLDWDNAPRSTTAMDIRFDNLSVAAADITGLSQVPEPSAILHGLSLAACAAVVGWRCRKRVRG